MAGLDCLDSWAEVGIDQLVITTVKIPKKLLMKEDLLWLSALQGHRARFGSPISRASDEGRAVACESGSRARAYWCGLLTS